MQALEEAKSDVWILALAELDHVHRPSAVEVGLCGQFGRVIAAKHADGDEYEKEDAENAIRAVR